MPSEPDRAFNAPRALHPATIVLGIPLLQLAQALAVPAAAALTTGARVTSWVVAAVVIVGVIVRTLAWRRFRYSFDGVVVRVSRGVISRHQHSVEVARIQQVELDRSMMHRLLGVTTVRIETAGGGADLELRVVADADAVALRTAIRHQQPQAPAPDAAGQPAAGSGIGAGVANTASSSRTTVADGSERVILTVPLRHIALAAITGRQLLVLPAIAGAGLQLFGGQFTNRINAITRWFAPRIENLIAGDAAGQQTGFAGVAPVLVVAVSFGVVIIAAVLAAAAVGIVRDGGFVMRQEGPDVVVQRGLLSTRSSTIPLRRMQLVEIVANPLRRGLGVSAVRIHSAGRGSGGDRRVVVPLVSNAAALRLARALLADGTLPALASHPPAARRRATWRWMRRLVPTGLAGALIVQIARSESGLHPAALANLGDVLAGGARLLIVVAAVSGLAALAMAWSEHRLLAHGIDDRMLVSRTGALGATTMIAPLWRIQAATMHSSWLQRRLDLASVTAHTAGAGGDVTILDVARATAIERHRRLTAHAAQPAITPQRSPSPDHR